MVEAFNASSFSWRRFVWAGAIGAVAAFWLLLGFVVAVDPYDTGRYSLLRVAGLPAQTPRTADASRGRDPVFDSAILGNSHVQLLSPAELSRLSGDAFVSLAVPGTGPREQFVLLDYFLRTRESPPRALVIGIDPYWCRADPAMTPWEPFPFWLYDRSDATYLGGLIRDQSLDDSFKRISFALGLSTRPRARPDGYANYDEGLVWRPERNGALLRERVPSTIRNDGGFYPALVALGERLSGLPDGTRVVLVRPPVFILALPEPGSDLDREEERCRAALHALTVGRPFVGFVDWRLDRPETRVPENFIDPTHYRSAIARAVEADIASTLTRLSPKATATRPRD